MYLTFIGTGLTIRGTNNAPGIHTIVQNLPYGTHVIKIIRDADATPDYIIDGVTISDAAINTHAEATEFTIHQPKMPPIPEDAVVIADYMLMADFVKQSTTVTEGQISKGVRVVSGSRDHFCDGGGAFFENVAILATSLQGLYAFRSGTGSFAQLPFFGTRFLAGMEGSNVAHELTINSTSVTEDVYDCSANAQVDLKGIPDASVATLGLNTAKTTLTSGGYRYWGIHIDSPIHTSSHYQTFETPFLHELVGGDRNMEQTNLVVTPDGKTWDQVTRDVSYIGNQRVCTHGGANTNWEYVIIHDEWRGVPSGSGIYNVFNKDFAIAYDRMICLVDGEYKITVFYQMHTGSKYHEIRVNGSIAMRANNEAFPSSGQFQNQNITKNIKLKRGDYVQDWGAHMEDTGGYGAFEIERLN